MRGRRSATCSPRGRRRCLRKCSPRSPSRSSTTAGPTTAPFRRVPRAARAGVPHRRTTSCSSPAPAPGRWSPPSRTSARRATAWSSSRAGAFGERWQKLTDRVRRRRPDASSTSGARRRARTTSPPASSELGGAKAVFLTHSETSTGVVADLQALAAAAKASGALVVVDAVSSLGAVPLEPDAWGIDVVASGSQKALMTPPGLGLATVSPARWAALGTSAALLLRLGAHARRPGEARQRVHACRLARQGAERRARPPARRGPGRGVRPARPPRPRLPRGREGDGPRALLARRGPLGRRHRDPHARGHRRAGSSARLSATASGSPSPAATAT